jgi:PAS domain S-box-containing protein
MKKTFRVKNLTLKYLYMLGIIFTLIPNVFSSVSDDVSSLKPVRLQLKWKHQYQFAGYYAAIEKGYYRDAGLYVELIEAELNKDPRDAVFDDKAEFGVATSDIIFLRDKGKKGVVLATIFQHSPEVIITPTKMGVQNVSDLAGKTIAMESDNSEIFAFLTLNGLTPEKYSVYPRTFGITELIEGEVDAISAFASDEPFELKEAGFDFNLLFPQSGGIDFYGDILFTSEDFILSNPTIVHDFRDATLEGWKYAMKNQQEIIDLIYNKYSKRHSKAHLAFEANYMIKMLLPDVVEIGYSNPDKWQKITDNYKKLGLVGADFSNEGLLYNYYDTIGNDIPWKTITIFVIIIVLITALTSFFYFTMRRLKKEVLQRQYAEQELGISETLYRSVLNALPDTVIITDLNGMIQLASPSIRQMFGYNPEEVMNHSLIEYIDPVDHGKVQEEILKMFEGDFSGSDEYKGIRSDGSKINIEVNGDFIRNTESEPIKMVFVARDISDRKLAEEKLMKSEETYRGFVETINDVIYEVALDGTIIYVSPAIERILGFKPDELLGKNFFSHMLPEDRPAVIEALSNLGQNDFSFLEYRYLNKSGEVRWVRSSTRAIMKDGVAVGGNGSLTDINERKLAEQKILELNNTLELKIEERTIQLEKTNEMLMRENAERIQTQEALMLKTTELENFFNVALDLLCIADTSGRFVKVNKAWETILGYSAEELEKRTFLEFIHPDDLQATLDAMQELSAQNPILNFINRYQTKDGTYKYIEWRSTPVGNLIYAAARDITEQKRAFDFENELLQLTPKIAGIRLPEIPEIMNLSLERIGKFLRADRTYIYEFDFEDHTMSKTHEWCGEGIVPNIHIRQNIPFNKHSVLIENMLQDKTLAIGSVDKLPEERAAERDQLLAAHIKSTINIPLSIENRVIGFIGLDSVSEMKDYNEAEIKILRVWSGMLASLINNQRAGSLLEETRQNYETFFNTIDDFLFVFDVDGNIVDTNQTVRFRLGYSDEELKNKSVMLVRPQEFWEQAQSALLDLLSGKIAYCSIPLLTKSGAQIPVETRVKQGFWNGKPVIFGVSKDISQIKISEQKFASAFQSNSAMMAISLFEDGKYVDINNVFLETLGFTREEIIGHTNKQLELFPDPTLRDQILGSLDKNIPVRKLEILMRMKDGTVKTGLLSADSIEVDGQRCLITTTMDISERKRAEDELRKARLEADQANMAKSEFLSRMSHELRTPMNAILGFAQLLEMGELNAPQQKGVTHILHSGKHLLNLINEVLDISRIESGNLALSLEPVNIGGVVSEMHSIIRPLMQTRSLTYKFDTSFDPELFVKSDNQRLKQILLNLLNNAVKYNREAGSITVGTEIRKDSESNKKWVRLLITDTGLGISKENIPKLFNPFERIGAEQTATEGTGLGLAVVKKLITAMGGFVGVESEPGVGSTFWIELPHIESQIITAEKEVGLSSLDPDIPTKSGIVLYIEDNMSNIELIEQVLSSQRSNIQLFTDSHGGKAVALALELKPGLILLDLNLPDMHGSEVLQSLQENEETRKIPVVVISADAMPQQLNKLLNSGAKNYLTKPLDIFLFLKIIDEYILD